MAKKSVAGYREKIGGKLYSKVIKMFKSTETGSYIFKEKMVLNESVNDFFENDN
ncbi:MAG: DUF4295 domain-containing protein [Bacteroidales bacterium OttesenSCG-928-I14]|jgi:hypothetical protein|nr:DUF4295 domain-containing protein [Bacteroidales bacterium OttesenSCG-928-I14]